MSSIMTKKRYDRRNKTEYNNFTLKPSRRSNSRIYQYKNTSEHSTEIGKASLEATQAVPVIDGRSRVGSQAVTYFIAGSLLLVALYFMGKHVYRALKQLIKSQRKPRKEPCTRKVSRKESSTKLMIKEENVNRIAES